MKRKLKWLVKRKFKGISKALDIYKKSAWSEVIVLDYTTLWILSHLTPKVNNSYLFILILFWQAKLRSELEEVETILYAETATKCMKCEENPRSVTLNPCNHYVLCEICAKTQRDCPYCQTPISSQS